MTQQDLHILRELGKRYAEIANHPANIERTEREYKTNSLIPTRPLVWVYELPWHEMNIDGELDLLCQDEKARGLELRMRRTLLQWKHFQGDMIVQPALHIRKSWSSTGFGFDIKEETFAADKKNNIVSHHYEDQLDSLECLDRLHLPVITAHPEKDRENIAWAEEILHDILPVRLTGTYYCDNMWDQLSMLRGVEPILMDMIADPELVHETARRFTEIAEANINQMEALGLFDNDLDDLHCTPAHAKELDDAAKNGGAGKPINAWYRIMAQFFSAVSPAMYKEYVIDYVLPLASRFGLTYNGCCEALHDRVDTMRCIPNLRKIGVSPWAKVDQAAESIGGDYVFSRKPNPALVAGTLDEDAIRNEVRESARACLRYGCPWDYTLKDISTCSYKPQNIIRWVQLVEETLDEFY